MALKKIYRAISEGFHRKLLQNNQVLSDVYLVGGILQVTTYHMVLLFNLLYLHHFLCGYNMDKDEKDFSEFVHSNLAGIQQLHGLPLEIQLKATETTPFLCKEL